MQKAYNRTNYKNYPNEETPLGATNLNKMDYAIDEIDDRVIALDTTKLDVEDADSFFKDMLIDDETGVITIVYYDNTRKTYNTNLNKIAVNFTYNRNSQSLILTMPDGTTTSISLSDLIQDNEFMASNTITFDVTGGFVSAEIKAHSITDEHLRTNYLADIRTAEANAYQSERDAEEFKILSESFARGNTNSRQGEDTDNSKYYSELADSSRQAAEAAKTDAENLVDVATRMLTNLTIQVNLTDGHLYYDAPYGVVLQVDSETGRLMYDVSVA